MDTKTKVISVAVALVVIALVAAIVWQYYIIKSQQDLQAQQLVEMKQLKDGIIRSESKYVSKEDLEQFAQISDINLDPIRDDLDDLNANLKGINNLLVSTPGYVGTGLASNSTSPRPVPISGTVTVPCTGNEAICPNLDTFGYLNNSQTLSLSEPFSGGASVPWGKTEFKAWEEKPWNLTVYPRTYSVTTVLGEDENGRHYTYNKFYITSNGETYTVPINSSKFVEEAPEAEFRFNPRLYLGVDVGSHIQTPQAEVTPNIGIALFSYGSTKLKPDFTFVHAGVGFNTQTETPAIMLTPVTYNLGEPLPLVENLQVGPSVSVDTDKSISVMLGVKVGL